MLFRGVVFGGAARLGSARGVWARGGAGRDTAAARRGSGCALGVDGLVRRVVDRSGVRARLSESVGRRCTSLFGWAGAGAALGGSAPRVG